MALAVGQRTPVKKRRPPPNTGPPEVTGRPDTPSRTITRTRNHVRYSRRPQCTLETPTWTGTMIVLRRLRPRVARRGNPRRRRGGACRR